MRMSRQRRYALGDVFDLPILGLTDFGRGELEVRIAHMLGVVASGRRNQRRPRYPGYIAYYSILPAVMNALYAKSRKIRPHQNNPLAIRHNGQ